jgi:hypothetical protein
MQTRGQIRALLAAGGFVFLLAGMCVPAQAVTLWNEIPSSSTDLQKWNYCDSSPAVAQGCGGNGGWTVYDNFTVPTGSSAQFLLTGFSYVDFYDTQYPGHATTYNGTVWSIWTGDPTSGGTQIGTLQTTTAARSAVAANGLATFTVTGIQSSGIILNAGVTYWIGIQTVGDSNTITYRAVTTVTQNPAYSTLPGFSVSDQGQAHFWRPQVGFTAFSIQGDAWTDPNILSPEPATITLFGGAFLALAYWKRRRG